MNKPETNGIPGIQNGVTKPLIEFAEIYEITYKTVMTRWYRGQRGVNLLGQLKYRGNKKYSILNNKANKSTCWLQIY